MNKTRLERAGKFREFEVKERAVIRRSGDVVFVVGRQPKVTKEPFLTAARATRAAEREIAALREQGWAEPGLGVEPAEREPTLEAAIRANRDDPAAYSIYADWLQERQHPIGELIALELAEHSDNRIADLRRDFGVPWCELLHVEWRRGLWSELRIEDLASTEIDPIPQTRAAFGRLACAALDQLTIGVTRWNNENDVPDILRLATEQPWAADLRSLILAADPTIDLAHWSCGDVGGLISTAFPRLEKLHIRSGERLASRDFDLPELRALAIETCFMTKQHLANLVAGKLPKLTSLELWFGAPDYGVDVELADLAPILTGATWPHVTELGLCNFEQEDQLARTIMRSALAGQLTKLDLSKGTMDDASAAILAAHRASFPKLEVLDVSSNFLTAAALANLQAAFAGAEIRGENQNGANGDRYVSYFE